MGDVSAVRRRRAVTVWPLSLLFAALAFAGCGFPAGDPPAAGGAAGATPAAVAAAATPTHTTGPDAYERSGRTAQLRLVLPGPDTAGPYPLVIALHSLFHSATETDGWGLSQLAETAGFAMVSPDGIDGSWDAGNCCGAAASKKIDDVAYLHALIEHLEANYPIDPTRVLIVGLSNGGMLAYRYACEHPEDIAGIAVVAGSLEVPGCAPRTPVTVVSVHGGKDQHVPAAGTPWQPDLGAPITSTVDSLAPFRALDRCEPATSAGDVTATGPDGAPRLSDALSTGSPAVTPAQIRATLAGARTSGDPASGGAAPITPVPVSTATSPTDAVRTESTCAASARVVDYFLPDVDHGWPASTGPAAFDTATVVWRILSGARANPVPSR
ncbi:PHB depolymerase family esterase [Pseudofrankia sp. DC12]|uniref:alpha/beta hydrolase family esterase n=1 Tax=Pseudofrankia sp. DC12 TaxID=683315 RepID=UPI0005F77D29|nr:PHB depolymerase family esterase [Pseudofrankia sp. DC12]